jgi:hypothetical protein
MLLAMVKIVTPGHKARSAVFTPSDPGVHLKKKMMDGRVHRRAEATPSFGWLCPAMTAES